MLCRIAIPQPGIPGDRNAQGGEAHARDAHRGHDERGGHGRADCRFLLGAQVPLAVDLVVADLPVACGEVGLGFQHTVIRQVGDVPLGRSKVTIHQVDSPFPVQVAVAAIRVLDVEEDVPLVAQAIACPVGELLRAFLLFFHNRSHGRRNIEARARRHTASGEEEDSDEGSHFHTFRTVTWEFCHR